MNVINETTNLIPAEIEAERYKRLWCAVFVATLKEFHEWQFYRQKRGVSMLKRWYKSADGQFVLFHAGLTPNDRLYECLKRIVCDPRSPRRVFGKLTR